MTDPGYRSAPPKASAMIEALRGLGYSTATALADIIDNSIAAGAQRIDLTFHWAGEASRIAVLDDGSGMSDSELDAAMRLGDRNPLHERSATDLGRFGLGLKTASFSQCRCLTVASARNGEMGALRWDLDVLANSVDDGWYLLEGAAPGSEPFLTPLVIAGQGTLVLWERLDRIVTGGHQMQDFLDLIDTVERHLAMVFHRFLEGGRFALEPLLRAIDSGEFRPTRNTVLLIDEVGQIGPRPMLKLLDLQAKTGMTVRTLGDREQAQAIEAGDAIDLLQRTIPKSAQVELLSTVRQTMRRGRKIAGLFRDARAADALEMKREDGTALLVGGDQDQVVEQIADLYIARRDALTAAGARRGITVSAMTNEDAADISRAIRGRLKRRGEIEDDEAVYQAIAPRGRDHHLFDLPIATGDRLRLYRRTWAQIDGKGGAIGNNGDIVEVVGRTERGLRLRARDGRIGEVEWRRLVDADSGRLLLGFGHVLTIDAAQGMTSDEHINALPRGTSGIAAFKAYVAESRSRGTTWTMISEAAVHEAEKRSRALGDAAPVTRDDLWARAAKDMSEKPYKSLAVDLVNGARRDRERATNSFLQQGHVLETWSLAGRDVGRGVRERVRAAAVRKSLGRQVAALDEAIRRNGATLTNVAKVAEAHLRGLRREAEQARVDIERAVSVRHDLI